MLNQKVKDHIKEVMNMALKTNRAQMTVPKTMLRLYMLELKLMGILVTVENENELHLDWTSAGKQMESGRRGSSEKLLRLTSRILEKARKDN